MHYHEIEQEGFNVAAIHFSLHPAAQILAACGSPHGRMAYCHRGIAELLRVPGGVSAGLYSLLDGHSCADCAPVSGYPRRITMKWRPTHTPIHQLTHHPTFFSFRQLLVLLHVSLHIEEGNLLS